MIRQGLLRVRPTHARLTRDTELFAKMDPYVKLLVGTRETRGAVARGGDKAPRWPDEFEFQLEGEPNMQVTVMDKDLARDDVVGSDVVWFDQILSTHHVARDFPIFYDGTPAGTIHLEIDFFPRRPSRRSFDASFVLPSSAAQPAARAASASPARGVSASDFFDLPAKPDKLKPVATDTDPLLPTYSFTPPVKPATSPPPAKPALSITATPPAKPALLITAPSPSQGTAQSRKTPLVRHAALPTSPRAKF